MPIMPRPVWWKDGVKFECQQSGKCCVSRGGYGYVYLTLADRKRMASHLGLTLSAFQKEYCSKTDGFFHLKEEATRTKCVFLKGAGCSIYEARPTQCRTWPFWPENMSPKAWSLEVATFCPGVGKGPGVDAKRIQRDLDAQIEAESKY